MVSGHSTAFLGIQILVVPSTSLSASGVEYLFRGGKWATISAMYSSSSEKEARERKGEINRKISSRKAISIILRREATKAIIEKKRGSANSRKLLPRTVLEALHERITAFRWESALKVFDLLREQLWYKPNAGIYIKLIVMLGKSYSRSGLFDQAFCILDKMKTMPDCQPDVFTYSILIKSCLQFSMFDKVQMLLVDMGSRGIQPNTVIYNTLIDAYGKAGKFDEMEKLLMDMLGDHQCRPDVWTMNATLRAFGNIKQIEMMEKCYEKFQDSGILPNIKTFNILLYSYGRSKMYDKMSAVMEYMQKYYFSWTLVTYNVLIDAFGRAGDLEQMEYLFRLMKSERIKPNCVTLSSLVRAYGRSEKPKKITAVLRFIDNSDIMLDTTFFNCLIDAYGRTGCFAEMQLVLEDMEKNGCKPDKVTYATMINAYSRRGMNSQVNELRRREEEFQGR
ncbi:unnamed protein product [Victoria cruziana]